MRARTLCASLLCSCVNIVSFTCRMTHKCVRNEIESKTTFHCITPSIVCRTYIGLNRGADHDESEYIAGRHRRSARCCGGVWASAFDRSELPDELSIGRHAGAIDRS